MNFKAHNACFCFEVAPYGNGEGIERRMHSDIAGRAGDGLQSTQGFPLLAYIPSTLKLRLRREANRTAVRY